MLWKDVNCQVSSPVKSHMRAREPTQWRGGAPRLAPHPLKNTVTYARSRLWRRTWRLRALEIKSEVWDPKSAPINFETSSYATASDANITHFEQVRTHVHADHDLYACADREIWSNPREIVYVRMRRVCVHDCSVVVSSHGKGLKVT